MAEDKQYTRSMMFRPSDKDAEALQLIARKNPVLAENASDLIRIALQDYVFSHGENGKGARIDAIETRMAIIEHDVAVQVALLSALCRKLNIAVDSAHTEK